MSAAPPSPGSPERSSCAVRGEALRFTPHPQSLEGLKTFLEMHNVKWPVPNADYLSRAGRAGVYSPNANDLSMDHIRESYLQLQPQLHW